MIAVRHAIGGAIVTAAVFAAVAACSSDDLPPTAGGDSPNVASGASDGGTGGGATFDALLIGSSSSSGSTVIPTSDGGGDDDDSSDDDDAGPTCLGDTSSPDAGAASTLCPTSGPCAAGCTFIANNYRAGVAQAAAACMQQQGASCEDPNPCLSAAAKLVCPTADATQFCTPLVKPCDPNADTDHGHMSTGACIQLANTLTTSARNAFSACMLQAINNGTCPDMGVQCIVDYTP